MNCRAQTDDVVRYAPGAMIVRFTEDVRRDDEIVRVVREIALAREEVESRFVPNLFIFRGMEPGRELELTELLGRMPDVRYAHRDLIGEPASVPNDLWFPQQWNLRNTGQVVNVHTGATGTPGSDICMVSAWNVRTDASPITVAILDSGVNYLHPDLAANMWINPGEIPGNGIDDDGNGFEDDIHGVGLDGGCAGYDKNDPMDYEGCFGWDPTCPGGHGTAVAWFLGAEGNNYTSSQPLTAMCGVAWKAKIMAIRVRSAGAAGGDECPMTVSTVLQAFEYAFLKGAKIVNCSWGYPVEEPGLYDAFNYLNSKGMLACVAAHNYNRNLDDYSSPPTIGFYPARYSFSNMLVVGASDQNDSRSVWDPLAPPGQNGASNYGAISVDVFAPGSNLRTFDGNFQRQNGLNPAYLGGTSYATPIAAGVCALVWADNSTWSAATVVNQIKTTARPVPGLSWMCTSGGVVNAAGALGTPCVP